MKDRLGVAGLGHMGSAIVRRLVQLGQDVAVFDVLTDAMDELQGLGVAITHSVSELAGEVDVLIAALPSAVVSKEVALEASSSTRLGVYIETSTIGVECITEISEILSGVDVIDAPLSGGPRGIEMGTISSYVSGSTEARDRIAPWFDQFCGNQTILGDKVGGAQIAKLVNNAISLSGMVIASEAIAVGVRAGIDAALLVDAVNSGTGRNSATSSKIPTSVLTGKFNFGGPIFLAEKDLELYVDMATNAGIELSSVSSSLDAFRDAIIKFGPSADYTEIARVFESMVGAEIRHRPADISTEISDSWKSQTLD